MITFFQANLLWTEGIYIFALLILCGILAMIFFRPFVYVVLIVLLFCFYFFRNPKRICIDAFHDKSLLVCPADGKVIDIQFDKNRSFGGYEQKISIFLSPFDVHVNWIPTAGVISGLEYRPGQFTMAFLPKTSSLNERNDILITHGNGKTIVVRQIAGAIARRICCWIRLGETVTVGQKYGMIRFGSRVDLLLPAEVSLAIGLGQRVYGGKTVLGRWICRT
jgi:phosphatidylserine decarboxylase